MVGSINVRLLPGNITDLNDNLFKGDSWNYTLVIANNDGDRDGIKDGLEIDEFLTDPTNADTDGDGIPDGYETEVVNSTGRDFDNDGMTNVKEVNQKTSPCIP